MECFPQWQCQLCARSLGRGVVPAHAVGSHTGPHTAGRKACSLRGAIERKCTWLHPQAPATKDSSSSYHSILSAEGQLICCCPASG